MKIGFVGMGKLGLVCALAIESKGHEVVGHDIVDKPRQILESKVLPYMEENAQELLDKTKIKMVSLDQMIDFADIIFVAVQTPHDIEHEGITRIPPEPKDFDYSYLILKF